MRQRDLIRGGGRELAPVPKPGDQVPKAGEPAPPLRDTSHPETAPSQGVALAPEEASGTLTAGVPPDQTGDLRKDLHAADHLIHRAVGLIEEITQAVRANASVSIANAQEAVESLLQSLETSDALLAAFFSAGGPSPSPAREAVNVCTLAVRIGLQLGYAPEKLRKLGLAAFLWEAGMAGAPAQLGGKRGELMPPERAILENTQRQYAKLIQKQGPEYAWLAELFERRYEKVKEPHAPESEREEYAAIIHLAEIAERLVHHRPFRPGVGTLDALKKILMDERTTFPDRLLKALIRILSTFPVGSLVLLNTGEIGRVAAKNKEFPLRPAVEMLVRQGEWLKKRMVIDLSRSPLHHIQDSFLEEALP